MSDHTTDQTARDIETALEEIRPLLALHRGNVDFVSYDTKASIAYVRLQGTCKGCPLSQLTLKAGIESILKEKIVGLKRVEAIE